MKEIPVYEIDTHKSELMYNFLKELIKPKECFDNVIRITLGYFYHNPEMRNSFTVCFGAWDAYREGFFAQHCFFKQDDRILDPTYYTLSKREYLPLYTIYKEYTIDEFIPIALDDFAVNNIVLNELPSHMDLLWEMGYDCNFLY